MLRFVLHRLRGRLALAAAVLLTVLITTAALTALAAFDRTVGQAGLREALQGPGHGRTLMVAAADHDLAARAKDDAAAVGYADQLYGELPHTVRELSRSRSYGLPGVRSGREPDLTQLAGVDRSRTKLLAGQWPTAATPGSLPEAAVPQSLLGRLGLTAAKLPADLRLDDRFGGSPVTVRITGVYRAEDRDDPYWRLDPLGGREMQVMGFTTYGPMLVDDTVFTAGLLPQAGRAWLLEADFHQITPAEAEALRQRIDPVQNAFLKATQIQSTSDLIPVLDELKSAELVARSTLLIGALQLTVLAGAALLLVVHLMTDRQAGENALLTARGATRRRLGAFTTSESLLLALPAAALAPLFTPPLLTALGHYGPLARVRLDTGLPAIAWPVAAACALACVLLTAVPTLLRGVGAATLRRAGRRQALVAGVVRSGGDLALLVLAVLAYQQLAHYTGGLSGSSGGQLSVDPVLVAAPTLALCAGTVLVLRLLPLAARLGGRLAARGSGLTGALVGWQLARRPGRASGPLLLLVLAVAMGVLAIGQRSAWSTSQQDQAEFGTAGGLRITASSVASMGQGGLYGALPGGDRLIPVVDSEIRLPGRSGGRLLALAAPTAAEHLSLRADLLNGRTVREVFAPLAEPAPAAAGVPLPGHPARLDVGLTLHQAPPKVSPRGFVVPSRPPDLMLLIRDRFGVTYHVTLPPLPQDGDATLSVDLSSYLDEPLGSAATPLTLAGLVVSFGDQGGLVPGGLVVHGISAAQTTDGPGSPVSPPAGLTWQSHTGAEYARQDRLVKLGKEAATGGQLVRLDYEPGEGDLVLGNAIDVLTAAAPASLPPAVATEDYLEAVGAGVGATLRLPLGDGRVDVRIVAAVKALPVVGGTGIAVDLATLERVSTTYGQDVPAPNEWWLPGTGPEDPVPGQAAAALRSSPAAQTLQLDRETAEVLLSDPVSAAPQSALAALGVAAAVLAAIGFAAASAAARAERAAEFAVLLAMGAPRRGLARTVTAEQGLLVVLGSAVGLGLGTVLLHLVIPLILLTPAARRPVPEAVISLPLGQALAVTLAIAVVPLLAAVFGGRRQRDLVARLRFTEEM
ncbi:hypothetical protein CFP65_0165 [Kitasatospora sp. MMS16-BH015]|uniref:FtsX-like permease family protein n=1 Tax=Kitasatospora sp. MMS16-BH015 TaxID=2018025 RepID=UPI000CA1F837|nr:ABC transporter permease [Kitasatospora sp. MMS16-BH015]AUG75148.1 hypothetical protein CFP65_0165 [Kitasatospora sp. MMS16-BH015]